MNRNLNSARCQPSVLSDSELASAPVAVMYLARHTEGGSAQSLLTLVRGLDRRLYEPRVIFHTVRDPEILAELRTSGIRVTSLVPPWPSRPRVLPRLNVTSRLGPRGWRGHVLAAYQLLKAIGNAVWFDLRWQPALARELLRHRPEVIHCNSGLRAHRLDLVLCWILHIPAICHVRNYEPLTGLEHLVARCVSRFIFISKAVGADYQRQGIPAAKGTVIPNALNDADLAGISPLPRAELQLEPDDFVVVNVGRLVRWKGQDVFLRAIAELAPRLPRLRALIVGGADDDELSRAFAAELRAQAAAPDLAGRVRFTGHRRDAQRVMAMADVVVHSAATPEPFGRVIIEALAAARPVIATEAGGVTDILEHEITGMLVPPGDAHALALNIERLAEDPALRERLAGSGRRHATAAYAGSQHVSRVTALYQQCLRRRRRPAVAEGVTRA
jgi:glycosyltransferase involved in cell wall biosynthesis